MRAGCVFALISLLIHILKDILRDLQLTSFIQLPNDTSQALLETFCCGAMMEAKHGAEEEDEDLLCVVCLASPTRGNEKRIAFTILWHMIRMAFAL